jgi:hypothetical protein
MESRASVGESATSDAQQVMHEEGDWQYQPANNSLHNTTALSTLTVVGQCVLFNPYSSLPTESSAQE